MNNVIEGEGALVNEQGEDTPLKAGDFALGFCLCFSSMLLV